MKLPSVERKETPEEEELSRKRLEMARLEAELADLELARATLLGEIEAFGRIYTRVVGLKYAELDEIEAELSEILAARQPESDELRQQATASRAKADSSQKAASAEASSLEPFKPTEDLKRLYRRVAKAVHPDLAADDGERERRTNLMAAANAAYRAGDAEKLQEILNDWSTSPEGVVGEGTGAELVRIIRQIARLRRAIEAASAAIEKLESSEMNQIRLRVEMEAKRGNDLLRSLRDQIEARIEEARHRLDEARSGARSQA